MNDVNRYTQALSNKKGLARQIVNKENKVYNLRNELEDSIRSLEHDKKRLKKYLDFIVEYESNPCNPTISEEYKKEYYD